MLSLQKRLLLQSQLGLDAVGRQAAAGWFVDSVAGSDSNNGRSSTQAFATLGALITAVGSRTNQNIALKRGSSWKEEFILSSNAGTRIFDYGAGALPLIDGSDTIANASFTLVGGTSFTYQATVAFTGDISGANEQRLVWQNGVFLTQVAFVAGAEIAAGCCAFSAYSGASATVYVRATDSSSVIANGKTYDYSKRFAGIALTGDNYRVTNIRTRRQRSQSGSLVFFGDDTWAFGCTGEDGNKHIAFCQEGGGFSGCTFKNSYNGISGSPNHVVAFKNAATSRGFSVLNCTFLNDAAVVPASGGVPTQMSSGIIAHANSGSLGQLTSQGNSFTLMDIGFGLQNVSGLASSGDALTNCDGIGYTQDVLTASFTSLSFLNNLATLAGAIDGFYNLAGGRVPVSFSNCVLNYGTFDMRLPGSAADYTFSGGSLTVGDTSARFPLGAMHVTGTAITLTVNGMTIQTGYAGDAFFNLAADTVYAGDNNAFIRTVSAHWQRSDTDVATTLANWRAYTTNAAVGHDANSTLT